MPESTELGRLRHGGSNNQTEGEEVKTKEHILMGANGELGLMLKLSYFDRPADSQKIASLDGYSVNLVSEEDHDLIAVAFEDGKPYICLTKDSIENCELLGEL